jgi:ribosome-associated translation inhibitor RaiA
MLVNEQAGRLRRFCDYITSCEVAIELDHHARNSGGDVYRVRVDVRVPPGHEYVGQAESDKETLRMAIRDAFHQVERSLKKHTGQQRTRVKRAAAEVQRAKLAASVAP